MSRTSSRTLLVLFTMLVVNITHAARADEAAAWRALAAGEAVMLMRHALAPGVGDPADFDVDDCATQRNLSDAGRIQARGIGHALADRIGTADVDVFSSAWCRCLETGQLLGLGEVELLPSLNSFFRDRDSADSQNTELREWIDRRLADNKPPAVLVTHQVNITGATGAYAASGEALIVAADGEVLLKRLLAEP